MRFKKFLIACLFISHAYARGAVILVVGTRPEAIKMAPLYQALKNKQIDTLLCSTGQHAELLESAFKAFGIQPDFDLKIMKKGQDLSYVTQAVLERIHALFKEIKPALVVVQGDTTTALAAALAAFYLHIPIAHVEAGLRTGNIQIPFPEEMNRRVITLLASIHFAPTTEAVSHLIQEGVQAESIFCTGNTVVDALYAIQKRIKEGELVPSAFIQDIVESHRKEGHRLLVLTAHRRESLSGGGLLNIFQGIKESLHRYPQLHILYPMHPNPLIGNIFHESGLDERSNISLLPPLSYPDMVYLLSTVDAVATDSGGLQEEAASLNLPVLVLRNETDRPEGLVNQSAQIVGTDSKVIIHAIETLVKSDFARSATQAPFGDGKASTTIAEIIASMLKRGK